MRWFFHKVYYIMNALFLPLRETLYGGCLNSAEASELFPYAVCQLIIVGKNGVLRVLNPGAQKDWNRRKVNREYICYFLYIVAALR